MLGTNQARGNLPICPALSEWITEELRKEAAVLKERRKAAGERRLAQEDKDKK